MEYTECSYKNCGNPVFALGICRKHYEKERLEKAAPCSISGCKNKAYAKTLCMKHYTEQQLANRPICTVSGCTDHQKTLKSGLCQKHLLRYNRHGSVEQPRNKDWGSRESHPLYQVYHWQRRKINGMCQEWADDFWAFVKAVGPRPGKEYQLRKHKNSEPIGPGNWYWYEKIGVSSKNYNEWHKAWRKRNPDKEKNIYLKKMYGITLDQYEQMSEAQGHVCAICKNKEASVDSMGAPRMLSVDHCHATGKIRALLCSACNKSLGGFKDDPALLRKAIEYVEKHHEPHPNPAHK